jgi:hypothetical protein
MSAVSDQSIGRADVSYIGTIKFSPFALAYSIKPSLFFHSSLRTFQACLIDWIITIPRAMSFTVLVYRLLQPHLRSAFNASFRFCLMSEASRLDILRQELYQCLK